MDNIVLNSGRTECSIAWTEQGSILKRIKVKMYNISIKVLFKAIIGHLIATPRIYILIAVTASRKVQWDDSF